MFFCTNVFQVKLDNISFLFKFNLTSNSLSDDQIPSALFTKFKKKKANKWNIGSSHSEVFNKIGLWHFNLKINASKVPANQLIFREGLVKNFNFTIARLFHRKFSNILRNVNTFTAELRQTIIRPVSF